MGSSRQWREWEIAARRARDCPSSTRAADFSNLGDKRAWYRPPRFLFALPCHLHSPIQFDEVIRAIFVANTFNKELYSRFSFQNFMYSPFGGTSAS